MTIPRPTDRIRQSPVFDFVAGVFGTPPHVVRYLVTTMSYKDADDGLRLVSELPGQASVEWKIEELFQRDIDWNRVSKQIVPYLQKQAASRFFNSITVMLLPIKDGRVTSIEDSGWKNPANETSQFEKVDRIGPINCSYYANWNETSDAGARIGQVTWNLDQVAAVAIDGQHRLAAIKDLAAKTGNDNVRVPVILILPARIGEKRSSLELTRSLFIDLNKHAVRVSRPRQILLDDQDVASACVRSLIGGSLTTGAKELDNGVLPLALVDWHGDKAKFEVGPYLTTILGLDWIVATGVGIQPINDAVDYPAIEDQLTTIEKSLDIRLSAIHARLSSAKATDMPFEFNFDDGESELCAIAAAFKVAWGKSIITMLSELRPYAELIALRNDKHTSLTPQFASWYVKREVVASPRTASRHARDELAEFENELRGYREPCYAPNNFEDWTREYEEHKNSARLAFTVVFQRALFSAFFRYLKIRRKLREPASNSAHLQPHSDEPAHRQQTASKIVSILNHLCSRIPDFYSTTLAIEIRHDDRPHQAAFWKGSFVKDDGTIDFTKTASNRASGLIVAALLLCEYTESEPRAKFNDIWEGARSAEEGPLQLLRKQIDEMKKKGGFGERLISTTYADTPPRQHEGIMFAHIRGRLEFIHTTFQKAKKH